MKVRYTEEQKARALESVEEIGAKKTSETYEIPAATLYRWKRAADGATPSVARQVPAKKKTGKVNTATASKKKVEKGTADAVAEARELLYKDDDISTKIAQLEQENVKLREQNARHSRHLLVEKFSRKSSRVSAKEESGLPLLSR